MKDRGFSCTWGLWLVCDGMLFAADEWTAHMQTKKLWLEFDELVRGRLEERPEKQRDMYNEMEVPGP